MPCSAKTKSGKPCKGQAILGATVCRLHGGSAPQVRAAALARLIAASDIVAGELIKIARNPKLPAAARVSAANSVLDRAGLKPSERLELAGADGGPIQNEVIVRLVKADGR